MPTAKPPGIMGAIVIVIVLAAWEALSSITGIAGVNHSLDGLQEILASRLPVGDPAEARARMDRIQTAVAAAIKPQHTIALAAVTLPVAVFAIVAALRLNKGKRHSARWFARAAVALAAVETVQLVYAVQFSSTMRSIMADIFRASVPPASTLPANVDPAQIARTMETLLQVFTISSLVLGLGFCAAKIFACLYARHCARKPEVLAWTS
jgi:hypothetical protein